MNALDRDGGEPGTGSSRSFGLLFSAIFLGAGLWPLLHADSPRYWCLMVSLALLLLALLAAGLLRPLHRLWLQFGLLLGRIVNPLVMSALYFGVFFPVAMVLRLLGYDPLGLKKNPGATSYWIDIDDNRQPRSSMKDQF